MSDSSEISDKKRYEPPRVKVISLRPEEAVLGNCKSIAASGPAVPTCNNLGGCTPVGS